MRKDLMLGVYIVVGIVFIVASILGLKEAFALMSHKSDSDVFIGLAIIALLIACYTPLIIKLYRKLTKTNKSDKTYLITREDHHD